MAERKTQISGGIFIASVSFAFIVWTWWTAIDRGYFYPKASFIFPMFFVLGIAVILFPDYRRERIERGEDISELAGLKLLTARWWIVLVVALLAAAANYFLLIFL